MNTDKDIRFMYEALKLAEKGKGFVSPNPMVGAVVVKNGKIVGRGYHRRFGGPHAEVFALASAGKKAEGATLYINLEPCSTFGKTPPCTKLISESGIKRVVIATKDLNPLHSGRAVKLLNSKNIKVRMGVLEDEAKKLNAPFFKFITKGIPFVTIKVAQSLDGKIATKTGESRWITSPLSREYVQELRFENDAVMVGANTIIADNPRLSCRVNTGKQLKKIIVDSKLKIPLNSRIFLRDPEDVIIAATKKAPKKTIDKFKKKGAQILLAKEKNRQVDLKDLMEKLAGLDIASLLVEGGGNLIANLLKEKLADRMLVFIAPKIIGGKDAVTSVEGEGINKIDNAIGLKDIRTRRIGKDFVIEGQVKP